MPFQYGVESEYTRNQILNTVEHMVSQENGSVAPTAPQAELDDSLPSAPAAEGDQPSAPPPRQLIETFKSGECVVCLEKKV